MNDSGSSRTQFFAGQASDRTVDLPPEGNLSPDAQSGFVGLGPVEDQATVISRRPGTSNTPVVGPTSPAQLGRMLLGTQLGHYHLDEFVGGGGMGAVFRSIDTQLDRVVAVKVLSQSHAGDLETVRRFKNEAQSAARLDHENIGRVYYVGEDRGLHYIVFEFIEGVNLRDLVEARGPLPLDEAFSYTLQVAAALDHASRRDVVHRDIKPSNVLITPLGKAKLVDMGLARLHQVEHPNNDLTASGVTLGTFDYISPEQARDPRSADVRSDIYSLGCTLYYTLTGRPPFPEGTVLQKLLQHQGEQPPDPTQFRDDLPDGVTRILHKMLAKQPDKRYQRPRELVADLGGLADDLGMQIGSAADAQVASRPNPRTEAWVRQLTWAAPLTMLVLVALALHFIWSGNTPTGSDDAQLPPLKPPTSVTQAGQPTPAADNGNQRSAPKNGTDSVLVTTPEGMPQFISAREWQLVQAVRSAATDKFIDEMSGFKQPIKALSGATASLSESLAAVRKKANKALSAETEPATTTAKAKFQLVQSSGGTRGFASLREAVVAAKSGDKIELNFTGRSEERPLEIGDRKLAIGAAVDHQPVLVFRPDTTDPLKYPWGVIHVASGELSLQGVHLSLEVPEKVSAEGRSLFLSEGAKAIRLENCWLTIQAPTATGTGGTPSLAMFELRGPLGAEAMMMDEPGAARKPVDLQLKNCVVRGEGAMLKSIEAQPLRLAWENGLLTMTDCFLFASGGSGGAASLRGSSLHVELNHITANTPGGLCRLVGAGDAPQQLPLEMRCENSILIGNANSPLIDQSGADRDRPEDQQKRISWMGDQNFYEGYQTFWQVRGSATVSEIAPLAFGPWCEKWGSGGETMPSKDKAVIKQLPADRPTHSQTPADYPVAPGNPTRPGFALDSLPSLPDETRAARPADVRAVDPALAD